MSETRIALVILSAAALGACSGGEGSGGDAAIGLSPTPPPAAAPPPPPPPPAPPPPPPPTLFPSVTVAYLPGCNPCKEIAFVSTYDGDHEIYSANVDSGELARLTDNNGYDGEPAWSPDGRRLAFVSDRHFNSDGDSALASELYVMDADGSKVVRLTFATSGASSPTWSPDGTRIAYESSGDLWLVPAEGGTPRLLFSTPGVDGQPAWSPDGSRLVFVSDWFAYDSVTDVFVINADGSGFTALTDGNIVDQMNYSDPAWSPDGSRIAMTVSHDQGLFGIETGIGVASADGSGLSLLPGVGGTTIWGVRVATPSWSPDGTTIVYTYCGDDFCHLVWQGADGPAWGMITNEGQDPDWQR